MDIVLLGFGFVFGFAAGALVKQIADVTRRLGPVALRVVVQVLVIGLALFGAADLLIGAFGR